MLYPLAETDTQSLDLMPVVDAAVVRLAKNITLPMEDSASFKDPLARRINADPTRGYMASGAACHCPYLITVSNAV